ncbi:MAG: DNA mismatch repair protein, partial [Gammaproteobacteria bacterium]|nr:DNA mismatch repair protein [Gammaproteobacteria bacterium]NIR81608.1 DNA mismatch repair protein [Gammaproteobacteria bacterium]NIU02720.1 DNA mismatch repair protein [Gammaproteobacteria bacterium]NIV50301.1 DNA mismatch repair protein [Gammaproteobacteria bacterium]NIX83995.1 DNA mismatch repair protein [Gammaproteobacteria bacterium]
MQVRDSLQQGLSQFMAELKRLKQVVESARRMRAGEGPLLYLLDDILQGTNTAERRTAVRVIIRHLLNERAIGCATSHDLTLADGPELRVASRPVHFTETVARTPQGATLSFDFKLRPGIATSKNALELLKLVGLGPTSGGSAEAGVSAPTR